MRLGIMSFAHMHSYGYAAAISQLPGVELAGVADEEPDRGKQAAEQLNTRYFPSFDELLKADLDGVIITSANRDHRALTEMAAAAGKHILCEKPIATTLEDAYAMEKAAKEAGIKFQMAFPCRFIPSVQRLKALYEEGRLGRLLAIRSTNHGKMPGGFFIDPEAAGGGAVIDHTVHLADLVRWIFQTEFREVYCEIDRRFHDIPTDDCGLLTLELDNGAFMTIDPSWSRPDSFYTWGDLYMHVVGTDMAAEVDLMRQSLERITLDQPTYQWDFWGANMDYYLVKEFVGSIKEDREPSITAQDGIRALEVVVAAYESARSGQPVKLR
ncbi:MAG: Gfo/Idh/MocA family oxidoreductase [Firmicutes bacterium]|jgi:UDP-N-acetylglucosamine 3-dehydrogenase|nr:Gfo/Idh/MocA family oxidoreductase [Bacillota bacterium]